MILLGDNALDPNLPHWTNPNKDELKRICDQCDLSHLFTDALEDPENFKPPS